jgi:L-glutamine-phosphate cytidylyltransferase
MSKKISSIILAAGRGKRLKDINYPKSLIKINKTETLIDNIIKVLESNDIHNLNIITGYKKNILKKYLKDKKINFLFNSEWKKTNMVATLMKADKILSKNYNIISYADIFYKKSAIALLLKKKYDISITSSKNWKKIWKKRFKDPLTDAETFDYDSNFFLKEIGKKPENLKQIKGQYMGIIGVSHIGWKKIKLFIKKNKFININKISITELLSEYIKKNPKSIKVIEYNESFMEIDFNKDNQIKNQLIK